MGNTHRVTDANTGGGVVTTPPQSTVFANNLLKAVDGSIGTSHPPCPTVPIHCAGLWTTANGGPTVFAENIPTNKIGDKDTCGHARASGSPDVFNDAFTGGGAIVDDNPPYINVGPVPVGAQPSPPVAFETNTQADVHVYENNDDPDGTLGPAPSNTNTEPMTPVASDLTPPVPAVPPVQDCSTVDALPASFNWSTVETVPGTPDFPTFASFAASFALSANYTVADLTLNPAVSSYAFTTSVNQANGMSQKTILQNLCYLAKTILEPMIVLYGSSFTITSAFRNKSGGSQHNKGQAVDVQFLGFHGSATTGDQYYARAQDIRDNINFDQMILEWFGRNPWIHISSNNTGHRQQVLTQVSSNSYQPGLINLAKVNA